MRAIMLMRWTFLYAALLALAVSGLSAQEPAAPKPATVQPGRISGVVLQRSNGRPVQGVRVLVVGQPGSVETDLDGRFRTGPVPPGVHSVRTAAMGFGTVQLDSVVVRSGQATSVSLAVEVAAVMLEELVVESAEPPERATSDANLLAIQQAAPSAQDGISAEAISRTPDSDAGDAIARVTGVTVQNNNLVVVRGLNERFVNTLLNGSELPSPEPLKRVVPLDIFPANLLESIVTAKTATPDRPADFAGGSVEIKTREFPDNFTAQVKFSQEWNSLATFQDVAIPEMAGTDWRARDDGRRAAPSPFPVVSEASRIAGTPEAAEAEVFGESLRNVWTPAPRTVAPNTTLGASMGGQLFSSAQSPLGYVFSITYSSGVAQLEDRLFRFVSSDTLDSPDIDLRFNESYRNVEIGGIGNLTWRLGSRNKIGWKNFYTRGTEEAFFQSAGTDEDANFDELIGYQVRYIERSLLQTQLTGEHQLPFMNARLEWKGSLARATRDEPENRTIRYGRNGGGQFDPLYEGAFFQFRNLQDDFLSGQVDLSVPFNLDTERGSMLLKVGAGYRGRDRDFEGQRVRPADFVGQVPSVVGTRFVPPEELFSPELIGTDVTFQSLGLVAQSYQADDNVGAAYAMVDLPIVPALRAVAGVRVERWEINVFTPNREAVSNEDPGATLVADVVQDYLPSVNLTWMLGPRVNLRAAAFVTVSRPDPRELTLEQYIGIGGQCSQIGNPNLQRAKIYSGDLKYEFYPSAGELISVSGFYKYFDQPVITVTAVPGAGECQLEFANAESAVVYGAEVELRKSLAFLSRSLANFSAAVNFTLVHSQATLGLAGVSEEFNTPALQGQSPYVVNASLSYQSVRDRFSASVLLNAFGARIDRYGALFGSQKIPDATEQGRLLLDAKLTKSFGNLTVSLAGRNLTGASVLITQQAATAFPVGAFDLGTTVAVGFGYDF